MLSVLATLLSVVLPAFSVIGVGALVGYALKLDPVPPNRLALYATTPALVFSSLSSATLNAESVGRLLGAFLLMSAAMLVISSLASVRLSPGSRRGVVACSLFVNSANLMLPVTLFAVGEAGVERALVLYVVTTVLLYLVGPVVFSERVAPGERLRSVVGLPVVWAALLAALFNVLGWSLPLGVSRGVELLAGAAVPLVCWCWGSRSSALASPCRAA